MLCSASSSAFEVIPRDVLRLLSQLRLTKALSLPSPAVSHAHTHVPGQESQPGRKTRLGAGRMSGARTDSIDSSAELGDC